MLPYKQKNVALARALRRRMTPWERKLWYDFLRSYPVRFQRQKPIGGYIVDFYCARARLVVELDGSGHYNREQQANDFRRDSALSAFHLTVLRFSNLDVWNNFDGVCQAIDAAVREQRNGKDVFL